MNNKTNINEVPIRVLQKIVDMTNPIDQIRFRQTCKRFYFKIRSTKSNELFKNKINNLLEKFTNEFEIREKTYGEEYINFKLSLKYKNNEIKLKNLMRLALCSVCWYFKYDLCCCKICHEIVCDDCSIIYNNGNVCNECNKCSKCGNGKNLNYVNRCLLCNDCK